MSYLIPMIRGKFWNGVCFVFMLIGMGLMAMVLFALVH